MRWAEALRRDLSARNQEIAIKSGSVHELTTGEMPSQSSGRLGKQILDMAIPRERQAFKVFHQRTFRHYRRLYCIATKSEYATLLCVPLRTCTVAVKDLRDVEHSIEVSAETLYEAIASALAALQQDSWVGEIGQGFATVTVVVQQPPVKHEVKMKDFVSWLGRQGRSPAEVVLKQKLERILGKINQGRT